MSRLFIFLKVSYLNLWRRINGFINLLFSSYLAKHDKHIFENLYSIQYFLIFVFSLFSMLELSRNWASPLSLRYYFYSFSVSLQKLLYTKLFIIFQPHTTWVVLDNWFIPFISCFRILRFRTLLALVMSSSPYGSRVLHIPMVLSQV